VTSTTTQKTKKRTLLDTSKVSKRYSITITRDVNKELKATPGDEVAFCLIKASNKIIITADEMQGGEKVLGASKMSSQHTVSISDSVRKFLNIEIRDRIQYWLEPDGRISIEV